MGNDKESNSEETTIFSLPGDILNYITEFLKVEDFPKILLVNKKFNSFFSQKESPFFKRALEKFTLKNCYPEGLLYTQQTKVNKESSTFSLFEFAIEGNLEGIKKIFEEDKKQLSNLQNPNLIYYLWVTLAIPHNENGETPWYLILRHRHQHILDYVFQDFYTHGTINERKSHRTLFHWAAICNQPKAIDDLIKEGISIPNNFESISIDTTDNHSCTPLYLAAAWDNLECVKRLLAHGANPLQQADNFYTPILIAKKLGYDLIVKEMQNTKARKRNCLIM